MSARPFDICVFTGTRAEYGLLTPLLRRIEDDADLKLRLLVSGAHLAEQHGDTWRAIEDDGFTIDVRVPLDLNDDSPLGMAHITGQAVSHLANALVTMRPDLVVILGDRYEAFACATAATLLNIPIAHIHGGEITHGAIDDALRHAITKMAHLHFTAAEAYRDRVIQMGEAPDTVFNVGALGLETIRTIALADRESLGADLDFDLSSPLFVITYHPVTREQDDPTRDVDALLAALDDIDGATMLFTKANADAHGQKINARLKAYCDERPDRAKLVASLGQKRYLSAVALADVVIGNSSSGIIEAPALGTPVVNIGDRQGGRLCPPAVVNCTGAQSDIAAAITHALSAEHRARAAKCETPYDSAETSAQIVATLKSTLRAGLKGKTFYDIAPEHRVYAQSKKGTAP